MSPSLKSLQVFEAVVRHCSFTRAADELFITQAAVSHHIRYLEDLFQIKLIHRSARHIEISNEGQRLADEVKKGLYGIYAAVDNIIDNDVKHINLCLNPSFASHWFVHHLSKLWQQFPDIQLTMNYSLDSQLPENQQSDISIIWGRQKDYIDKYPLLFQDLHVLMIHHQYVDETETDPLIRCLKAIKQVNAFVHEADDQLWIRWQETYNHKSNQIAKHETNCNIDDNSTIIAAIENGIAAGFGRLYLLENALNMKQLYAFTDFPIQTDYGYFLAVHSHVKARKSVIKVKDFILQEAAKTQRKIDRLLG